MITIKRHPNLDNWIEVRYFGKLLDQFTSAIKAHRFASQQAAEKKTRVFNFDHGVKAIKKNGWINASNYHVHPCPCLYYKIEEFISKRHNLLDNLSAPAEVSGFSSVGGLARKAQRPPCQLYHKKKFIFFRLGVDSTEFSVILGTELRLKPQKKENHAPTKNWYHRPRKQFRH